MKKSGAAARRGSPRFAARSSENSVITGRERVAGWLAGEGPVSGSRSVQHPTTAWQITSTRGAGIGNLPNLSLSLSLVNPSPPGSFVLTGVICIGYAIVVILGTIVDGAEIKWTERGRITYR